MKFLNEYWKIISSVILITLSMGGLQAQVAQNKVDIQEGHDNITKAQNYTDKQDSKIIVLVQNVRDEVKKDAEKVHIATLKEIEKIKVKQEQNIELKINQQYLIKGLNEVSEAVKSLANEIRASERRRK